MSRHSKSTEYQRLVEQETLIADAGEIVCELLEAQGIERKELARRLGKTKGFVTQILSGERNMTLRSLADLAYALDHRVELRYAPLSAARTYDRAVGNDVAESEPQPFSAYISACSTGRWERRPGQTRTPITESASGSPSEADSMLDCDAADENHSFSLAA
jgi:transcriptional regulator with XRE-family HTH domain